MPERPHPDLDRVRDALRKHDAEQEEPEPQDETPQEEPEAEEDDGAA